MFLMLRILSLLALALTPLHMAAAGPIPAVMAPTAHHAMDEGPVEFAVIECCGGKTSQHGFCQMPAALPVGPPPLPRAPIRAGDAAPQCPAQQHGRSPPPDLRPPIRA